MTTSGYIVLRKGGGGLESARRESSLGPAAQAESARDEGAQMPQVALESLSAKDVSDARRDPSVAGVAVPMPVSLVHPRPLSAEDSAGDTWGISATMADRAEVKGEGALVAVLDTGIDRNHVAFKGVELVVQDFTDQKGTGHDGNGHGTHCAGTIFGRDVAGRRIGVAPGIRKALVGKVLSDNGGGTTGMIFNALQWAAEYDNGGVDVISMSLGFDFPGYITNLIDSGCPPAAAFSRGLRDYHDNLRIFDAMIMTINRRRARDEGIVIVAASGNENLGSANPEHRVAASLPAAAEGIVSVGAAGRGKGGYVIAPFSNSFPTLSAPGVGVLSAQSGGGLMAQSGTSMACPHVAGIAALWWDHLRREAPSGLTSAKMVEARLMTSLRTDVFEAGVADFDRGLGLVTAPMKKAGA